MSENELIYTNLLEIDGKEARFVERYNLYITVEGRIYRRDATQNTYSEINSTKVVPVYDAFIGRTTSRTAVSLMGEAFYELKAGETLRKINTNLGPSLDNLGIFSRGKQITGNLYGIPKKYLYPPCSNDDLILFIQDYDCRQPDQLVTLSHGYEAYSLSNNGCVINNKTFEKKKPSFSIRDGLYVSLYNANTKTKHIFTLVELMLYTYMYGCPPGYKIRFRDHLFDPAINNLMLVDPTGETYTNRDFDTENVVWKNYGEYRISNLMHVKLGELHVPITRHHYLYNRISADFGEHKILLTDLHGSVFT